MNHRYIQRGGGESARGQTGKGTKKP